MCAVPDRLCYKVTVLNSGYVKHCIEVRGWYAQCHILTKQADRNYKKSSEIYYVHICHVRPARIWANRRKPKARREKGGGDKGTKGTEERKKVTKKLRNLGESDEPWR